MFLIALAIFIAFSLIYLLLSAAIFYHLRQYTLPGRPAPRIIMLAFIFLSALFWLFSATFLLKIPT